MNAEPRGLARRDDHVGHELAFARITVGKIDRGAPRRELGRDFSVSRKYVYALRANELQLVRSVTGFSRSAE
jgi:hypothetical protein